MYQSDTRSRTRQRLNRLCQELAEIVDNLIQTRALWRGIVYENVRKCGKPTCHCAKGEPHRTRVLADRSGDRQQNRVPEEMDRFVEMTEAYRAFRRGRVRIVKILREMHAEISRLEAYGLEDGRRAVAGTRRKRRGDGHA